MTKPALDIRELSLTGTHLVEASAGTGKTYSIVSLYLRLLAEPGLGVGVDRILVVTFTEAATAELKQRLRQRLSEAIRQLSTGRADDELVAHFLAAGPAESRRILGRFEQALLAFDQAEVHTIHGLCRRVLEQHGLDAGMLAGAQILADTAELFEEVTRRFLALEVYSAPRWFSSVVRELIEPRELVRFLESTSLLAELERSTGLCLLFPSPMPRDDARFLEVQDAFAKTKAAWIAEGVSVASMLAMTPGLNQTSYGKGRLERLLAGLDEYLRGEDPLQARALDTLGRLATGSFKMRKGHVEPAHRLFDEIRHLHDRLDGFALQEQRQFLRRLAAFSVQELEARKRQDGVMTFDDLVVRLEWALRGPTGENIASALRLRYSAALVDEFQDTDAQQYAVFRRVFADAGMPLFLIGDPKQAIYGFRGADVHAYLRARADAQYRHTLLVNRRSDPALVRAVNAVFSRQEHPFGGTDISFEPAGAWAQCEAQTPGDPPFEIVFLGRRLFAGALRKVNQGEATEVAAQLASHDIAQRRAWTSGRTVAVLVRSNRQVVLMQEALRARGVAAVGMVDGSVFETDEAIDLSNLFAALLDVTDQRKVRAALLTPLMGVTAAELGLMDQSPTDWQVTCAGFARWAQHWAFGGALSALRHILTEQRGGRSRAEALLERERGREQLSNYEHIAEQMSLAARSRRFSSSQQWRWLSARCGEAGQDADAALRMAADAAAVRVMTVHKSKGLEFDEVYCPFLWAVPMRGKRDKVIAYHDSSAAQTRRAWILPGAEHPVVRQAALEQFEEELRLAYVALTRAKRRCVVYDGVFGSGWQSTAWLLHAAPNSEDPSQAMDAVAARDDESLIDDLRSLAKDGASTEATGAVIAVSVPESYPPRPAISAALEEGDDRRSELRVRRTIEHTPQRSQVLSFTALCSARAHGTALIDDEEPRSTSLDPHEKRPPDEPTQALHLADFEHGARAGDMFHKVLETVSWGRLDREVLEQRSAEILAEYGYDEATWRGPVTQGLWEILHTPLWEQAPGLTLAALSPGAAVAELEFLLPMHESSSRAVGGWSARAARAFETNGGSQTSYGSYVASLPPQVLHGYLRGFVDLVFEFDGRFYIVDYKSHDLGTGPGAYAASALHRAMQTHHYVLQYHLYCAALDRYLAWRLSDYSFERCFGGVFYLFLRGMSPSFAPGSGVFYDRPTAAMIDSLSRALGIVPGGRS